MDQATSSSFLMTCNDGNVWAKIIKEGGGDSRVRERGPVVCKMRRKTTTHHEHQPSNDWMIN